MNSPVAFAIRFAIDIAVKATVLFAATGLALFALRRASAATRHLVGTAGLAAALALPFLALALPRVPLPILPGLGLSRQSQPSWTAGIPTRLPAERTTRSSRADATPAPGDTLSVPAVDATAPSAPPARRAATRLPWLVMALTVWALGAFVIGTRLVVGWFRVRRIAREASPLREADWIEQRDTLARELGVRREVALLESPAVPVAMTSGLFRPLLLLGQAARSWAIERRRVVLLHELAHVKRGDWLWLVIAEIAGALFWFHPAVWFLSRQVRRDGEKASDDLVLAAGTKPSVYAGHLLGIFRSLGAAAHPVAPALAIARPSHFEERLKAILAPVAPRGERPGPRARLSAAALFAAAAAIAVVEPWAPARAVAAVGGSEFDAPMSVPALPAVHAREAVECEQMKALRKAGAVHSVSASASATPSADAEPVEEPEPRIEPGKSVPAIFKMTPAAASGREGFVTTSNGGGRGKRSGGDWYSRGMDLHHDERYDEAIEAFQKSIESGHREEAASYNIACGYALKGDANKAFEWLGRAMDAGFDVSSYLEKDDDLDGLKSDPRWKEFKKTARERRSSRHQDEAATIAKRYERLMARAPKDGEPFFEIGMELLRADRYDLSAKAFAAAAERDYRVGTSLYNEACALSRGNQTRQALDVLQKALDAGFDQPDTFRKDDDLDNVRDDPRYAELLREAKELSLPGYMTNWKDSGLPGSRWKWRESSKKYESYARAHPQKGRAWFNLGYASLAADRPEAAVEAFQKALDLGYRKPTTLYNLACTYARLDQKDKAFDWLFKALDAGFDASGTIRGDEDLDNLRGDPRFRKALDIAKAKERAEED